MPNILRPSGLALPPFRYLDALATAFVDITGPEQVQVQIADNRIWVNVDGTCVLRICRAGVIEVEVSEWGSFTPPTATPEE